MDVLQNALLYIGASELIFGHLFDFLILFVLLLIQCGSLFGKHGQAVSDQKFGAPADHFHDEELSGMIQRRFRA